MTDSTSAPKKPRATAKKTEAVAAKATPAAAPKPAETKPAETKPVAKKPPAKPAETVAAAAPKPAASAKSAPAPKPAAAPKPAKAAASKSTASKTNGIAPQLPDQATIDKMVAEAAYYLAEKRNFATGYEQEDWAAAKAQIMSQLKKSKSPT